MWLLWFVDSLCDELSFLSSMYRKKILNLHPMQKANRFECASTVTLVCTPFIRRDFILLYITKIQFSILLYAISH